MGFGEECDGEIRVYEVPVKAKTKYVFFSSFMGVNSQTKSGYVIILAYSCQRKSSLHPIIGILAMTE